MINNLRESLVSRLPLYVYLLFVIQIFMDVASFWVVELGVGNTLTLLLRLGMLGITLLLGFFLSRKKKVYFAAAGVLGAILMGHVWAVFDFGCNNLVSDLTNFVRVAQMPLMVLCLITFMEENGKSYDAMKWGMTTGLLLTLVVQVLAVATKTEPHTYHDGSGYIGWFSNTNSQSSNLCMLVPVAAACTFGKKGLKSPLFWVTMLGGFVSMYFLGTRLAYFGLGVTAVGLGISLILISPRDWKRALAFFAVALVFVTLIPFSPMMRHQRSYEGFQSDRQNQINQYVASCELPPLREAGLTIQEQDARKAQWIEALTPVYEEYVDDFVEIFGAERTISMYDYSYNIYTLTVARPKKLRFAALLMEESPVSAQAFGLELSRFTAAGNIYDVENDLHGMYYLYGWAGLIAMVLFLLYFVYLILWALIRNAKRYFTWDAASWGIGFLLCLPHIYCTAGVLRRPSASIYLSAALAAVFYLVKIKNDYEREGKGNAS